MSITVNQLDHLKRIARDASDPGVNLFASDAIVAPVLMVAASDPDSPFKKERIKCASIDDLRHKLREHHVVEALWMDDNAVACSCTIQQMPQGDFLIRDAKIQSGNKVLTEFNYAITELPGLALPTVFIEQAAKQVAATS